MARPPEFLARVSLLPRIPSLDPPTAEARLLQTLQELMALPPLEYPEALAAAATRIAHVLTCEKVDAFLLDDKTQTLRALGTSDTPLGRRQRELGLHALPLANGGRTVEAFKSGVASLEHHAELDPDEVRGLVEELGIRSTLSVPST